MSWILLEGKERIPTTWLNAVMTGPKAVHHDRETYRRAGN